MPTIWGTRAGSMLIPYAKFREALDDFAEGERLRITVDRDRNRKFSALFHVMLGQLAKAINRGPATTDIEKLKQWLKLKNGWFDVVPLPQPVNGVTHAIAYKSTAFASMGESEFHTFCRQACDLIRDELAPWIRDAPEWPDINAIIATIQPETTA